MDSPVDCDEAAPYATHEQQAPTSASHGEIAQWLDRVSAGGPQTLGGLDLIPLLTRDGEGPRYRLLHEAVGAGTFEVLERGGGSVNELLGRNLGDETVLITEGASLTGAKQNRTVVETVLVGVGMKVSIPVGCVEQGRWRFVSQQFEPGAVHVEPCLRKATVVETARAGRVNQPRLWQDVDRAAARRAGSSPTRDYFEAMAARLKRSQELAAEYRNIPGQTGLLVLAEGRLVSLELFGHPGTWAASAEHLIPSYLVAADLHTRGDRSAEAGRGPGPEDWLEAFSRGRVQKRPGRGLGEQIALAGPGYAGAGLWADRSLAHLAVFPN